MNMGAKITRGIASIFGSCVKTLLRIQNILIWLVTLLWSIVMFLLLLLPGDQISVSFARDQDKCAHFLAFMLFSALLILCVPKAKKMFSLTNSSFVMVFGSGCGVVTELMQHVVPGRTPCCFDGVANIAGVVSGIILTNVIIFYSRVAYLRQKEKAAYKNDIPKDGSTERQLFSVYSHNYDVTKM